jgi:hypothetical protein
VTFDLSRALDEIAGDAADRGRPADPDRVVGLRRRRRAARRGAAGVAVLSAVGVVAVTGATLTGWRSPDPRPALPAPATSAPAVPTPDGSPATPAPPDPAGPTAPATEEPAADDPPAAGTAALADPFVSRWDGRASLVSDAPASGDGLEDGDFFGSVLAVDPGARTITVDLGVFYGGAAAGDWAGQHAPDLLDGGSLPPNGYVVVDDVQRSRTVRLAPGAAITGFCVLPDGEVVQQARELAGLTEDGDPGCIATSAVGGQVGGSSRFWLDVRGGEVAQLVGQYLP